MNCQQNDLAIVVGSITEPSANGKIVRCLRLCAEKKLPAWEIDPPIQAKFGYYTSIMDQLLRPIRNPGADEVDEMVLLVERPDVVKA